MGNKPGASRAFFDGLDGFGGLADVFLAAGAGVLGPHVFDDVERRRDVIELLGDVLAKAYLIGAAFRADLVLGRHVMLDAFARKVFGKRLAAVSLAARPGRGVLNLGLFRLG